MSRTPVLTALLTLVLAAPAAAQTVLLKDDAEGDIATNWVLNTPEHDAIHPWQKSDSTTVKLRGNQAHGGATSYWAGSSPPYDPQNVVQGQATMQLKQPLIIPADGKTTISLWSLLQMEGDDLGLVEAALDTGSGKPAWKRVADYKRNAYALGDAEYQNGYCDLARPDGVFQQPFEEIKGDFTAFAGKKILLRINLQYGGENRIPSHPCGWYVDDIQITTTGTPGNLSGATPTVAGPPTPSAEKPTVKFGATKLKGKRATLSLNVSGAPLRNATLTLLKGSKRVATARAANLPTGARKVVFRLKRKLKRGTLSVRLTGTYSDGATYTTAGKTKAR